jgi:hypothetical protein
LRGLLWRYGVILLPLVGVIELIAHFYFAGRAPRFDEYDVLREAVAQVAQPGDLVVAAPAWTEPMVRRALGDEIMPLADVARPSDEARSAVIEVSTLGQRSKAFAAYRLEESTPVGDHFVVRRLLARQPGSNSSRTTSFVDRLGPDGVRVELASVACRWSDNAPRMAGGLGGHPTFGPHRFMCAGAPHYNVGVTVIADHDFLPRRCIWAHPPKSGELTIRFRDVDLGQHIVGHGGMYWMIERERSGAPVQLRVDVRGEEVGRYIHADGDGWSRFEMGLGRHANTTSDVTFRISSEDNARRHFCFEARTQ